MGEWVRQERRRANGRLEGVWLVGTECVCDTYGMLLLDAWVNMWHISYGEWQVGCCCGGGASGSCGSSHCNGGDSSTVASVGCTGASD